jgi:hypothetical protein
MDMDMDMFDINNIGLTAAVPSWGEQDWVCMAQWSFLPLLCRGCGFDSRCRRSRHCAKKCIDQVTLTHSLDRTARLHALCGDL